MPARAPRRRVPALTHDPSSLFQPPEAVGPFRVRRALASGTLGPRLLVEDERGRLQALKLITDSTDDADALVRVLEHVRKSLPAHPGLLPVSDVGASPEGVYLVSPVVEAPSVETRLRGGRQTLEATLAWLRGVTGGLQAAHDAGVWHGAIHPRDVLVSDEGGVLTGVGVAPALEHLALQAPVRVPYTAPERASGQRWDARADQYSLAMLALDALSGRRLIAGTIPAFDRWSLAETPTEDARLHDVFVRALHPDPAQRYPSLEDWLGALEGSQEPGRERALSRFAREGVILAAPVAAADASRDATPAREIEVQPIEDPEGVALSLFPEEDGTIESPVVARPATAPEPEAEQEWLVADVPAEEPAHQVERPFEPSHDVPDAAPAMPEATPPAWQFDDEDGRGTASRDWEPADDSPRRGPWLLLVAALVIAALAYGTWRSLQGPAATTTAGTSGTSRDDATAAAGPAEPGSRSADPGGASAARPGSGAATGSPQPVPQAPVPSRQDRRATSPPPPSAPGEPPAAVVTTEPAATASTGRVLIRSSPSGEVRVNGRSRGETPVVLRDLPFGSYVISVSRAGFTTVERSVDLLPSQPVASVTVDLARQNADVTQAAVRPPTASAAAEPAATGPPAATQGSPEASPPGPVSGVRAAPPDGRVGGLFVVSSPPQARLYVDGRLYGSTPASIPGLSPGPHAVRIEAAGYRTWQGQVEVMPGTRTRVQATLQQEQE